MNVKYIRSLKYCVFFIPDPINRDKRECNIVIKNQDNI